MKWTRRVLRGTFLVLAIFLLVDINRKTDEQTQSIAEFKIKMFDKVRADSLNPKDKLDLLINETSRYVDNSARVKNGISYLMRLLSLFLVTELLFIFLSKRNAEHDGQTGQ